MADFEHKIQPSTPDAIFERYCGEDRHLMTIGFNTLPLSSMRRRRSKISLSARERLNRITYRRTPKGAEIGDYVFIRGPFKKRYIVCRVGKYGHPVVTNAEVRYMRTRKSWGYYIDGEFVEVEYKTLKSAKAALGPTIVDRLAAEFDTSKTT